jgi:hypothetical protein
VPALLILPKQVKRECCFLRERRDDFSYIVVVFPPTVVLAAGQAYTSVTILFIEKEVLFNLKAKYLDLVILEESYSPTDHTYFQLFSEKTAVSARDHAESRKLNKR